MVAKRRRKRTRTPLLQNLNDLRREHDKAIGGAVPSRARPDDHRVGPRGRYQKRIRAPSGEDHTPNRRDDGEKLSPIHAPKPHQRNVPSTAVTNIDGLKPVAKIVSSGMFQKSHTTRSDALRQTLAKTTPCWPEPDPDSAKLANAR